MTEKKSLKNFIIEGIQERKGKNISVIDLSEIDGAIAKEFIICQGTSTMQVSGIADSIREYVQKETGIKPYNYEGYQNAQWIIIDYGEIFVHVFLPESRQFYNIEELWNDAPIEHIPDLD
ncbi:MAG: ribosome silencing factor [Muribaculum sp.]|nr:ribosome silencing factor [Muribaculaceae bacterium]MCM1081032.1 ribosome silencing factor [Muribaculum sp.]